MNNYLVYLVYGIPVIFIVLSRRYYHQFKKLKYSGKIPRIIVAKDRQVLCAVLAILSTIAIIIF